MTSPYARPPSDVVASMTLSYWVANILVPFFSLAGFNHRADR